MSNQPAYIKPVYIFFIIFPSGISQGFASVTLPYLLTQHGFSVGTAASIVAIGVSANLWRFLWGPVVDMSLSLKKWYGISLAAIIISLLFLCFINYSPKNEFFLTVAVFISQIAATFLVMPITGFIAKCIPQEKKGAASGWYQGGSLTGLGLGGGAGLWLANHYSVPVAGIALSVLSLVFATFILLIKDVQHSREHRFLKEISGMFKDIIGLVKIPVALFTLILICLPIGSGASANLWSAIAGEWKTSTDMVALVTGLLSGLVSALGCVAGGFLVDKKGVWFGYLTSGAVCAIVTLVMALMPANPSVFITGVLMYTFGIGLINAAFSAAILFAIGKKNVATKYALLASFGNLPVVYMTAINGWTHDHFNSKAMLLSEALVGFLFILICMVVIKSMQRKNLLSPVTN